VLALAGVATQHLERAAPAASAFQRDAVPQYMQVHYRPCSAAVGGRLYAMALVSSVPDLNDRVPDTSVSSKLSSAESTLVTTAPNRHELPYMPEMPVEPDESVVGDNFTNSFSV
jgi:hypothetical protein